MKKTIAPVVPVATSQEVLPARVQEALGELVGVAREGLLALSVGVGLGVLAELMEEEVTEVVGAKGKHDRARVAVRHGHESGQVTLGGRRVAVERPRVRSAYGSSELPLVTYRHFADRDPRRWSRPPHPGETTCSPEDVPLAVEFRRRSGDVILSRGYPVSRPFPRRSISSRSERLIRPS